MQKLAIVSSCALLTAIVACGPNHTKHVVLFQTTDEHSSMLAFGPEVDDYPPSTAAGDGKLVGGIARRSTLLKNERAAAEAQGAATFTFSSGDNFTGTLFQAAALTVSADYRALKALGYDATTLGNHEFDNGPLYLAGMIGTAMAKDGLPAIVASNLVYTATSPNDDDALKGLTGVGRPIQPWLVVERNGVRIGVLGILGKTAFSVAPSAAPVTFLEDQALFTTLKMAAKDLRDKEKVDLVVLLAHAGTDPSSPTAGDSAQIALNVPGIDVILSGHTHTLTAPYVLTNGVDHKPVVLVEPGWDGNRVARLSLTIDKDHKVTLDPAHSGLLTVDNTLPADPALLPLVNESIASLEAAKEWEGNSQSMLERSLTAITGAPVVDDPAVLGDLFFRPLGHTDFDLPRTLRIETGALRLGADAFLATSNLHPADKPDGVPEVGLTAFGIVHDGLHKGHSGAITLSDAFRTYANGMGPDAFGHYTPGYPMVRFALPIAELKLIFEITALTPDGDDNFGDNFIVPSGATFAFDRTLPPLDLTNPMDPARGRVTRITLTPPAATPGALMDPDQPGQVVFDLANPAWGPYGGWCPTGDAYGVWGARPVLITTDIYMAMMSASLGLPIYSPADSANIGKPGYALGMGEVGSLILWRPDGSSIRSFESYAAYVRGICAANGGNLPVRYQSATATRVLQ